MLLFTLCIPKISLNITEYGINIYQSIVSFTIILIIISAIVIIVGAGAYYLVSPLFVSTEINEPLPTGSVQSESFRRFITMNEEEKLQAAKQMSSQDRDEIMSAAARTISASVVAKTILDAITSNNPKLRYVVGEDAAKTLEARKNMPDKEFGGLLKKQFGI